MRCILNIEMSSRRNSSIAEQAQVAKALAPVKPKTNPYIISKRTPTTFNPKVAPLVLESADLLFIACGNLVNVYSLTTNLLLATLRSKRQQQQADAKAPVVKGDVHKGNIVGMMCLNSDTLVTVCSRGILAEWDAREVSNGGTLRDIYELRDLGKIKHTLMTNEKIVIFDSQKQVFKFFDIKTKALVLTLKEEQDKTPGQVNGMSLSGNTFVYIKGRSLFILDLLDQQASGANVKTLVRDSLLRSVEINDKANLIAIGDDVGKIYIVHNTKKQLVVQTLHWHSHKVNALKFIPETPYLLSGGEEAVIVQWHLETQSKSFISRLGAPILNLSLSHPLTTYYTVLLSDNSAKVIRFDNNKLKSSVQSLQYNDSSTTTAVTYQDGTLIVPFKGELQFYNIDDRTLQSMHVKQRNYVSKSGDCEPPQTQVKAYCMTPDKKQMVTYEELRDRNGRNKDISIQAVKFWCREVVEEDTSGFQVKCLVQNPCIEGGVKMEAVDNREILIVNGSRVQVWGMSEDRQRWSVQAELSFQDLKVEQVLTNQRLRLQLPKETKKQLVMLHKEGVISIWDQNTYQFIYSFRLNKPSKKIVFESSMRYLASQSVQGGVEVWKVKGSQERYEWELNFKSVKDLMNNSGKENQFVITMNSTDDSSMKPDSILLFQYSRPQNLIMYWKAQLPFLHAQFCHNEGDSSSYVLLINKNKELQKIFFGVTRDDLKQFATKRRLSLDTKLRETERALDSQKKSDYHFIDQKQVQELKPLLTSQLSLQEIQINRLDKVDKLLSGDTTQAATTTFLGMPSLSHYFEQFAQEMLSKPSKATNFMDLQEELFTSSYICKQDDIEMKDEQQQESREVITQIEAEVCKAFEGLFKQ